MTPANDGSRPNHGSVASATDVDDTASKTLVDDAAGRAMKASRGDRSPLAVATEFGATRFDLASRASVDGDARCLGELSD